MCHRVWFIAVVKPRPYHRSPPPCFLRKADPGVIFGRSLIKTPRLARQAPRDFRQLSQWHLFLEPIFLPKLQIHFVDFPFLHFSFKLEVLNLRNLLRLFVRFNKRFFFFCKKNQFFEFSWIIEQICIYLWNSRYILLIPTTLSLSDSISE